MGAESALAGGVFSESLRNFGSTRTPLCAQRHGGAPFSALGVFISPCFGYDLLSWRPRMGCKFCKSVEVIEQNTMELKATLEATREVLASAESKIATLEASVTSITGQISDVRADLAKVLVVMEQVPQLASGMEAMKVGQSVMPSMGTWGLGGLFGGVSVGDGPSPDSSDSVGSTSSPIDVSLPPVNISTPKVPSVSIKVNEGGRLEGEEKSSSEAAAGPKKKLMRKKVVKKPAAGGEGEGPPPEA